MSKRPTAAWSRPVTGGRSVAGTVICSWSSAVVSAGWARYPRAARSAVWYRRRAWMNCPAVPPRSGWASAMARRSCLIGGAGGAGGPARPGSPRCRWSSAAARVAKNSRAGRPGAVTGNRDHAGRVAVPAPVVPVRAVLAVIAAPGVGLELLAADAAGADDGLAPVPAVAGVVDQLCRLLDDRHLLDPAACRGRGAAGADAGAGDVQVSGGGGAGPLGASAPARRRRWLRPGRLAAMKGRAMPVNRAIRVVTGMTATIKLDPSMAPGLLSGPVG